MFQFISDGTERKEHHWRLVWVHFIHLNHFLSKTGTLWSPSNKSLPFKYLPWSLLDALFLDKLTVRILCKECSSLDFPSVRWRTVHAEVFQELSYPEKALLWPFPCLRWLKMNLLPLTFSVLLSIHSLCHSFVFCKSYLNTDHLDVP